MNNYLVPEWPAPACVRTYVTTRNHPFNLADNVGDAPAHVEENRLFPQTLNPF